MVVLIRGINVGRAKRVSMADLRAVFEELGYREIRTLLNSGNVVFAADSEGPEIATRRTEEAMAARRGVQARVTVLTASDLATIVAENPLKPIATDPSRHLAAVLADPRDRVWLDPLLEQDWSPEALALGPHAAYLWCPAGVSESRLWLDVDRALGDGVTTRNWSTMTKLLEMTES